MQLIHGDCLEVLPTLPEASIDAVVTDPPYGLEFMGKEWDSPWKYGLNGHGFTDGASRKPAPSFNSSRNPMCRKCHKHKRGSKRHVACACAEPDFDETEHRLNDLAKYQAWCQQWATAALRVLKPGAYLLAFGGTRTYHRLACAVEDAGFEVRDCVMWLYGSGFPKGKGCLKPAWEPILVCRKPGPRVLPLGIDECRVACDDKTPFPVGTQKTGFGEGWPTNGDDASPAGRWPANVAHDGSEEVLEAFAAFGERHSRGNKGPSVGRSGTGFVGGSNNSGAEYTYADSGTAARFYFCAKASKRERGEGNGHPTVKPLALMEWLVKLVCPVGGTVLDPFAGSGTTLLACERTGRKWVGIEREAAYVEIARRRLAEAAADAPLFTETA